MLEYKQIGPSIGNLEKNKETLLLLKVVLNGAKTNCSM